MSTQIVAPPERITKTEAARILGCSRTTVHDLIESGRLPAERLDPTNSRSHVRIMRSDVQALIGAQHVRSADQAVTAIQQIVDAAPPLTEDQRTRLAALFGGAVA